LPTSQPKTTRSSIRVAAYIAAITDDTRRAECRALITLMRKLTCQPAKMWGSSIVGFGCYHYKYDSGREGDAPLIGFSSRKPDISVYLLASGPAQKGLLARLGRHKMGKACLSIRRLSDVSAATLEDLIADSVAESKRRYG
jgi:hypothetical protein